MATNKCRPTGDPDTAVYMAELDQQLLIRRPANNNNNNNSNSKHYTDVERTTANTPRRRTTNQETPYTVVHDSTSVKGSVQYTLYSVNYTVQCIGQCTVYSVQCTLYTAHFSDGNFLKTFKSRPDSVYSSTLLYVFLVYLIYLIYLMVVQDYLSSSNPRF